MRDGRKFVTQSDLEESIEVVIAGYQKKNAILTDAEKRIVAYHEIGHALVAAKQTNSAPVQKITIIPRTSGALGYTMQVEEGNHYLMNQEELENKIATLTGGRAAEEVVFGSITTGASNDIEQATKLARAMLTRYGMSEGFRHGSARNREPTSTSAATRPSPARRTLRRRSTRWSSTLSRASMRRPSASLRRTAPSSTSWPTFCTAARPSPARSSWRFSTSKFNAYKSSPVGSFRLGLIFYFAYILPTSQFDVCRGSSFTSAAAPL